MNEKREKQKEEEKVNKDRKMRSETIILRPEVPLLERLSTYAASDAYPFHMPGHKRQVKMGITSVPNPFSVDITEIDGFDNLHHAEDILKESMNSAAAVYGADRGWYLVNGSTCGILAAIAAAVKPGEKILMARNSHKSAYHAVVLNQLEPVYLYPEEVPEFQIPGGIEPEQVERALLEHPEIRAVFVTSPTYEGIVSDIQGIAATAHRHGAALIVDEAHGAHLPFGDGNYFPDGALQEGADPESSQDASIFDTDGDSASEKPDSGCEEGGTVFIGLPEFQPVVYSDCVDGELRPVYGRKRSRGDGAVWRAIAGTPGKIGEAKTFPASERGNLWCGRCVWI